MSGTRSNHDLTNQMNRIDKIRMSDCEIDEIVN